MKENDAKKLDQSIEARVKHHYQIYIDSFD